MKGRIKSVLCVSVPALALLLLPPPAFGTVDFEESILPVLEAKCISSVCLWQSEATQQGVRRLGRALPRTKVNLR